MKSNLVALGALTFGLFLAFPAPLEAG